MTGDDPAKATACQALFERVRAGTEVVLTSEAIIAEVVYVLSSRAAGYGLAARRSATNWLHL
jgi:predicted nucleic acid-binding protein